MNTTYGNDSKIDVNRSLKLSDIVRIASKPTFNETKKGCAVANFRVCVTRKSPKKDNVDYFAGVAWGELAERMKSENWDKGDTIDPYDFYTKPNGYTASTGAEIQEKELHIVKANFIKKAGVPVQKSPDADGEKQQEAE